jgi:hypothetical protein
MARKDMMERVTREDARSVCHDPHAVKRFQVRTLTCYDAFLVLTASVFVGIISMHTEKSKRFIPTTGFWFEQYATGAHSIRHA